MGGSLFEPSAVWQWVARRRGDPRAAASLVAIAAAGGFGVAAATEIGVRHFNTDWNYVAGYNAHAGRGWAPFVLLWAAATVLPLAQGLAGAWLLPLYGRPRDWTGGLAVGVIGALPLYASAPALVLLPGVLLACFAFLVSCAWWGSGARAVLGVPDGESADHVVASVVAGSALLFALAALVPLG
jgi:hypothetical protein